MTTLKIHQLTGAEFYENRALPIVTPVDMTIPDDLPRVAEPVADTSIPLRDELLGRWPLVKPMIRNMRHSAFLRGGPIDEFCKTMQQFCFWQDQTIGNVRILPEDILVVCKYADLDFDYRVPDYQLTGEHLAQKVLRQVEANNRGKPRLLGEFKYTHVVQYVADYRMGEDGWPDITQLAAIRRLARPLRRLEGLGLRGGIFPQVLCPDEPSLGQWVLHTIFLSSCKS